MSNSGKDELIARLSELGELESTATAQFHQKAAAAYGLGLSDMRALQLLIQHGPQTPGQLADQLRLTSGAITSLLDRLERAGMVARGPHPEDRRKIVITADQARLASADNVYLGIGAAYAKLQRGYTTAQLEFLIDYYEASLAILSAETAALEQRTTGQR